MAEPPRSSPPSIDAIKALAESLTGSAEWVVEQLQNNDWFRRLSVALAIWLVGFRPDGGFLLQLLESFFNWNRPDEYGIFFGAVAVGLFVGAIAIKFMSPTKNLEIKEGEVRQAVKGLRSFTAADADIFAKLQRERDIQNCLNSLKRKEFRFGILMGESGCGKTSLLQAGVLPRINQEDSLCQGIYIRFSDRLPLATLRDAIFEHLHPSANWQKKANQADLLVLLRESQRLAQKSLVLVFDQFEQFFITRQNSAERQQFITALAQWYKRGRQIPVTILISIRADLYHELFALQQAMGCTLGPYDVFKLELFEPEEAAEILQVMATTEGWAFDRNFILRLATDELTTSASKISPVDLQILAETVRKQPAQQQALDEKTFRKLGGLEGLLENYVRETLDVLKLQRLYVPALEVLLTLIDRDHNVRAGSLTLNEILDKLKGVATPREITQTTIWLASGDVRLISTIEQSNKTSYELAHERIIPAVLSLAGQTLEASVKANRLLERRVNEWLGNNRSRRYLFSWRELWLLNQQHKHLVWGNNRREKERLIKQSWQRIRRAGLAILVAIVLILSSFLAWLSPPGQIWQMQRDVLALRGRASEEVDPKEIARVFAKLGDPEKAIQAVETLEDETSKSQTLIEIAQIFGKRPLNNPQSAFDQLRISAGKLEEYSTETLATIEVYGWRENNYFAVEALNQIRTSTNDLEDQDEVDLLTKLAQAYNQQQEYDAALDALMQVREIIHSSNELATYQKYQALISIAEVYSELPDENAIQKDIVLEILEEAHTILDTVSNPSFLEIDALIDMARVHSQLQYTENALKPLAKALAILDDIFSLDQGEIDLFLADPNLALETHEKTDDLVAMAQVYGQLFGSNDIMNKAIIDALEQLRISAEGIFTYNIQSGYDGQYANTDIYPVLTAIAEAFSQYKTNNDAAVINSLEQLRISAEKNLSYEAQSGESPRPFDSEEASALIATAKAFHQHQRDDKALEIYSYITDSALDFFAGIAEWELSAVQINPSAALRIIESYDSVVASLIEVAESYGQMQNDPVASGYLETLFIQAKNGIKVPSARARFLGELANVYIQTQDREVALEALKNIRSEALRMPPENTRGTGMISLSYFSPLDRLRILSAVAEAYEQLEEHAQALEVVQEMQSIVDNPAEIKWKFDSSLPGTENPYKPAAPPIQVQNSPDPLLLIELAKAYGQLHNRSAALEGLRQVRMHANDLLDDEKPPSGELLITLSDAYRHQQKRDAALEVLGKDPPLVDLGTVAKIQADLQAWRQVRATADFCCADSCKLDVLSIGLTSWVEQRYPELKEEEATDDTSA
jgi:hypothetical protein